MTNRIFLFILGLIITGYFIWDYLSNGGSLGWIVFSVLLDIYSLMQLVAAAARGEN